MDEDAVRERAAAHGEAMVAGDLARAGSDLSEEAQAEARSVMRELPRSLDSAEIVAVEEAGEGAYVSRIRYSGEGRAAVVEARWAARGGRPTIVALRVVGS